MKDYQLLTSLFYKDKDEYEKLYNSRITSESTFLFPFKIGDNQAFVVSTKDILLLQQEIYDCNQQILKSCGEDFPSIAKKFLQRKILIDEIMLTNDIEGVYSTRREINDIIENQKNDVRVRFYGLVKKYETLTENNQKISLDTCEDIRLLYDQLVSNEIENQDRPDGKIFRKGPVSVVSVTEREKHKGVYPEDKIIFMMNESLDMLKSDEYTELMKIAVLHYMIGYIHPFYDGNGRLDRFISSYLLTKVVYFLGALRLSHAIKDSKKEYYDAFEICNNPKNKGDLTPFVLMFLKKVKKALFDLGKKIEIAETKMNHYHEILIKLFSDNNSCGSILFILVQQELFASGGLTVQDLCIILEKGSSSVRKILANQEVEFYLKKEKDGHAWSYSVNLNKLDEAMEKQ